MFGIMNAVINTAIRNDNYRPEKRAARADEPSVKAKPAAQTPKKPVRHIRPNRPIGMF